MAALLPPDHVNRLCYQAQDELFQRCGLVSSRALPPLIPIGWPNNDTDCNLAVLRGIRLIPFLLGPVVKSNKWVTIGATPTDSMVQIRHLLNLHTTAPEAAPAFPLDRVLLAAVEDSGDYGPEDRPEQGKRSERNCTDDDAALIETTSGQSIRTITAVLIEMITQPGATWWASVDWRVVHQRKITATR